MRGNAHEVAKEIRRRAVRFPKACQGAEKASINQAIVLAKAASSGPFKAAVLAQMGHPYAKRSPRPPQDPRIINLQAGTFLADWRKADPILRPDGIASFIFNVDPVAHYLQDGTPTMIARDLPALVKKQLRPFRNLQLHLSIRAALRGS